MLTRFECRALEYRRVGRTTVPMRRMEGGSRDVIRSDVNLIIWHAIQASLPVSRGLGSECEALKDHSIGSLDYDIEHGVSVY